MPDVTWFCTFSRVTPEKGVDDAVSAIREANRRGTPCGLDVWGPIEKGFEEHYAALFAESGDCVRYRGVLGWDDSLEQLSGYAMLLFPTFYPGEGFPVSVCECFRAGLPAIASDWRFNRELVEEGVTGFLFPPHDREALTRRILQAASDGAEVERMKANAAAYGRRFEPESVMRDLTAWIRETRELHGTQKPIGIIGYFGERTEDPIIGGQMSKTLGIFRELSREFGEDRIRRVDTSNWKQEKGTLPADIFRIAASCDPVLILPNKNGIRIVLPMAALLKHVFGYGLAYPVVGGWLTGVLRKRKLLAALLPQVDYLLPETGGLKKELREYYAGKMDVMPVFSSRDTWDSSRGNAPDAV